MIDDIYNSRILEFAGNIPRLGMLADADAEAAAHSKLCGSKVRIWLKMDGDVVTDFAHDHFFRSDDGDSLFMAVRFFPKKGKSRRGPKQIVSPRHAD